ncbi:hypothetical protein [Rhodovulum sp. 12E13]|uniref:hypothetical protein n=1 Tax=Rhodovulum sp. 12E13 TaxID=2203891 RepID=UPI0013143251|nr:hypothetical protein [Rhodovulum sp. 12E13]
MFLLDDGTEAVCSPKPDAFVTRTWEAINAFVEKRKAGRPVPRPLDDAGSALHAPGSG